MQTAALRSLTATVWHYTRVVHMAYLRVTHHFGLLVNDRCFNSNIRRYICICYL